MSALCTLSDQELCHVDFLRKLFLINNEGKVQNFLKSCGVFKSMNLYVVVLRKIGMLSCIT